MKKSRSNLPVLVLVAVVSSLFTLGIAYFSFQQVLQQNAESNVIIQEEIYEIKEKLDTIKSSKDKQESSPSQISGQSAVVELKCSEECDDNNPCTQDICDETTDFKCRHEILRGEVDGCSGAIEGLCQKNSCAMGKCILVYDVACCGNEKCEAGEDSSVCPRDCIDIQETTSSESTLDENTSDTAQSESGGSSLDHLTINEFTTRGPAGATDEFVELYNPTSNDIAITGWKLQYKSATGTAWQSKVGSGLDGVIKANGFFLLASKDYSLGTAPDYRHTASWGLKDEGGHVRMIDESGNVVDKVGWGDANEPEDVAMPYSGLEEGKSLERKSLETDTDNNSADFVVNDSPSPQKSS